MIKIKPSFRSMAAVGIMGMLCAIMAKAITSQFPALEDRNSLLTGGLIFIFFYPTALLLRRFEKRD